MNSMTEDNFAEDLMFSRRGNDDLQSNFHIGNVQTNQFQDCGESNSGIFTDEASNDVSVISDGPPTQANNNGDRPKRLSKGAMKRYKVFLAQGMSEEEARKKCLIIPPARVSQTNFGPVEAPKRLNNPRMDRRPSDGRYSHNSYNQSFVRAIPSLMNSSTAPIPSLLNNYPPVSSSRITYGEQPMVFRRRFSEMPTKMDPKQIKVCILPVNYPIELLTNDRMKLIEEQILKKIVLQKDSVIKPAFVQSSHRIGYMHLLCKDRGTVHWLKNLYNWSVENLRVVDSTETPTTNVVEGTFPFSAEMSTRAVFDMIEGQNAGVFTNKWKVISEVVSGSALHLIIAMDNMSLATLEREKFKLNYRFTVVKFDLCMGTEHDMIMSHKRFVQPNAINTTQFQGRESYGSSSVVDNGQESVYSSDILYNRH